MNKDSIFTCFLNEPIFLKFATTEAISDIVDRPKFSKDPNFACFDLG